MDGRRCFRRPGHARPFVLAVACVLIAVCLGAPPSGSSWRARAVAQYRGTLNQVDGETDLRARYLRSVAITEPEQLSERDLAHILELRRTYGLSDDPVFVRNLYEQPERYGSRRSPTGIVSSLAYAPDEREQVFRRASAEWVGYQVDLLAADLVTDYSATVIQPDGSVALMCAPCREAEIQEVRTSIAVNEPIDLVGIDVEYSAPELHEIADAFSSELDRQGIANSGVILSGENRVEILVSDEDVAKLPGQVPQAVTVEGGYELATPDVDKDDPLIYELVEGGQSITGISSVTSGFAVVGAYGPFMLSAGHIGYPDSCTRDGDRMYQGGSTLGLMTTACQYGGNVDGSLITTYGYRNNFGRVHYTSTNYQEPITFGVSSQGLVNQTVCQTGRSTTGNNGNFNITNRCGTVSSTASKSPCGGASPAWTFSLGAADYLRAAGDSGAAVVWPTIYGYGAAGTHSCVGFNESGAIFSRYSVMASKWGLSLSDY